MTSSQAVASPSRSSRFVRNVGAGVLGQMGVMVLSFLLTPRLIHALGVEMYGLYILFQAAAGYVLVCTMGSGTATVKYVAEAAAQGGRRLRQAVFYGGALSVVGAVVGSLILAVFAGQCAQRLFHVPAPLLGPAVFVLRCAALAAVMVAAIQWAWNVLQGMQRFDWQSGAYFLQSGLLLVGATALAVYGFGINGVGRWYVLWNAAALVFSCALAWMAAKGKIHGAGPSLPFRDFLGYSWSFWLGQFAWVITFQFDRLFIARAQSLSAVTYYSVPANLLQRIQFFPAVVTSVLIPMFTEIPIGDEETVRRLYLRSMRTLLFMLLPALVLLFCLMPQFLGVWLGGGFGSFSVWPARLLVAAQAFLFLTYVPNALVAGRGRPLHVSAMSWAQAGISVVAWSLLIKRFELIGVAIGSLLAQAIPACVYLAVTHRGLLKMRFSSFFHDGLLRPFACSALLLAAVFPFHEWASSWGRLFALSAAGLALYSAVSWLVMDGGDKDLFVRLVLRRAR